MDLWTHYVVSATTALMISVVQSAAYLTGRFGRWPLWWGASNALYGACTLAIAVAPADAGVVLAGNLGTIAVWLLLLGGVCAFSGRMLPGWAVGSAVGGVIAAAYFRAPSDFGVRLPVLSVLSAVLDLAITIEAVRLARREDLRSAWIMAALFGTSAAMMLARAYMIVADPGRASLFGSGSGREALLAVPVTALILLRDNILLLLAAERNHADMAEAAFRDPLTAALTRRGLRQAKATLLRRDRRRSLRAAVLIVDVDHFKQVNDRHGHEVGDALLRAIANALHAVVPANGLVARWGGDEFVVLLPGTHGQQALSLAATLARTLTEHAHRVGDGTLVPTLSIGVAEGPLEIDGLPGLINVADGALYAVKRAGRDGARLAEAPPPYSQVVGISVSGPSGPKTDAWDRAAGTMPRLIAAIRDDNA